MTQDEAEKLIELLKEYIIAVITSKEIFGDQQAEREIRSELVMRIVTLTGGVMGKPENVLCPDCNSPMKPRDGQFGKFWGCTKYPNCKGTRNSMGRSKAEREAEKESKTRKSPKDYQDSEQSEGVRENHSSFSFNKK